MKNRCEVFVFVCVLSSHRAKGAANNNDAGGADDSDLEKMKQVNYSSTQLEFLTKKLLNVVM